MSNTCQILIKGGSKAKPRYLKYSGSITYVQVAEILSYVARCEEATKVKGE